MKKKNGLLLFLLLAVLATAGCGSAAKSETAPQRTGEGEAAAGMAAETAAAAMDNMAEEAVTAAQASRLSSSGGSPQSFPAGHKLIRTVNMKVETDTFEPLLSGVQAKIAELGGYTESSDISGNSLNSRGEPIPRYASIIARIPSSRLDGFVTSVENKGNVTNKSESTSDVTLNYSDIESRKKSLVIEQDRIWSLLEKAESLDTVIMLEQRLSDIRYQLEAMESQLRLYDNQVEYSSVYLDISEVTDLTRAAPDSPGLQIRKGLADNLNALLKALTGLAVFLIVSSPYWVLLGVIALVTWFIIKKRTKRKEGIFSKKKPPAGEESEQ